MARDPLVISHNQKLELLRRYRAAWERAIVEEGGAALSREQVTKMKRDIALLSEIEGDIIRLHAAAIGEPWLEKRNQWDKARQRAKEVGSA